MNWVFRSFIGNLLEQTPSMQHLSRERIAILLEVLSFFLVTTDLYGSERLERLRDRIIETKSSSKTGLS